MPQKVPNFFVNDSTNNEDEVPDYFVKSNEVKPNESTDSPDAKDNFGWLDKLSDATRKFVLAHPKGSQFLKHFISGPSDEELDKIIEEKYPDLAAERKKLKVTGSAGPGFQQIPGVQKGFDLLANKLDNPLGEGGTLQGFGAGALQGLGGLISSGADPRAVGIGKPPNTQIPYRSGPLNFSMEEPKLIGSGKTPAAEANIPRGPFELPAAPERKLLPEFATGKGPTPTYGITNGWPTVRKDLGEIFHGVPSNKLKPIPQPITPEASSAISKEFSEADIDPVSQVPMHPAPEMFGQNPDYRLGTIINHYIDQHGPDWVNKLQEDQTFGRIGARQEAEKEIGNKFIRQNPPVFNSSVDPNQIEPTNQIESTDQFNKPAEARGAGGEISIGYGDDLGKILGRALYKGTVSKSSTKELLQNAIDATRPLGDNAKIDVDIINKPYEGMSNYKKGKEVQGIRVSDNGPGVTLNEMYTVFTNLAESGKRGNLETAGKFGIGKGAYLLGGEHVSVSSVVVENGRKVKNSFEGTPSELMAGKKKPTQITVSNDTPTGTTVTTIIPNDEYHYDSEEFTRALKEYSMGLKGKISVRNVFGMPEDSSNQYAGKQTHDLGKNKPGAKLVTLKDPSADIDIYTPMGDEASDRSSVQLILLNNGIYQAKNSLYFDSKGSMPAKLILDIKSKVPEDARNYPWDLSRENIREELTEKVKKHIEDTIIEPAKNKARDELQSTYDNMYTTNLDVTGKNKFAIYDPDGKLSNAELEKFMEHPKVLELARAINDHVKDMLRKIGNLDYINKIERIGFTLKDDGKQDYGLGVWIPNPSTKKVTLAINPFGMMMRMNPDNFVPEYSHTILHEIAHTKPFGPGEDPHGQTHSYEMARLVGVVGRKTVRNIEDQMLKVVTDANNPEQYNQQTQEVLQRYKESRGNPSTTKNNLGGLESSSENNNKPNRKRRVPLNNRADTERTATAAIDKLTQAIEDAKPLRAEQEESYSQERSERIKDVKAVKTKGEKGFYKQLKRLKGPMDKVQFESIRPNLTQTEVDSLFDEITNSNRLLEYEKISAKTGLAKLLGAAGGHVPQSSELKLLTQVFGERLSSVVEMHGGFGIPGALRVKLNDYVNVPKSIMASMDLSAPLRQGMPLIYRKEYWNSFYNMFKVLGEEGYNGLQEELLERPYYLVGKEAGLQLTGLGEEEAYASTTAEKIPFLGRAIKVSDRAYTGFLNKLRADTFDNLFDDAKNMGYKEEEAIKIAREIAKFVNVSTGRGNLGYAEKFAKELNAVFFSPRMIASRLTMLNPNYYIKATPFIRKEALKALFAVAGATLTINGLMSLMGAKVSTDPTNSDFMKSRFGNTRVDPNAGFQQYIVAATRLLTQEETSSSSGITRKFGEGFNSPSSRSILMNFGENKLSPAASFVDVMLKQKDFNGQPISVSKEIGDRLTPMVIGDIIDIYKDDPSHLPLGVAGMLGMGLQTYETKTKSPFRTPKKLGFH